MKSLVYLISLTVCSCSESNDFYGTYGNLKENDGILINNDYYRDWKRGGNIGDILLNKNIDREINYDKGGGIYEREEYHFPYDAGNPDIHGEIRRPCQAYDTFCIRKFFAEHSRCIISGRRLPDPFYRAQGTFNYASANISGVLNDLEYGGLNKARVLEFYINKKTDNLVIALSFDLVSVFIKNTYAKFYLRGREPVVTRDFGSLLFVKTVVTFVIPGLDDLRLDRAEITTYGDSPLPPFAIGPGLAASTDPEVLAMVVFLTTVNVPNELLEEFFTDGTFYGTNYLQYNICDFGLKVL